MGNNLKKRIMKRVYAIWFFKKIAPALFLYMPFLLFVALREVANEFFVVKIVNNFLMIIHKSGMGGVVGYIFSALANASVLSGLIIIVSLGVFVILLRKLAKTFRGFHLVRGY